MRSSRAVSMLSRLKMEYTLVRSQHSLRANHATERSWRRSSSFISIPMCTMAENKKAEPFVTYLNSEVPPSTVSMDKYEQFTPMRA